MNQSTLSHDSGNLPDLSRATEDQLDWLENQNRTAEDRRGVDRAFVGGFSAMTGAWLLIGLMTVASAGGVLAIGYAVVSHFAIRH